MKKFVAALAIVFVTGCSTMSGGKKDQPKVNTDFMGGLGLPTFKGIV